MKNHEVAKALAGNAKAYLVSDDIQTVYTNLNMIEDLLENPNEENTDYTWEDFK